ncbi:MAG: hypothetical protein LBK82_16765 [Planctomycetaceae bacterium]|nr:hypothetical protein [Planctomycetaceae bacterium]
MEPIQYIIVHLIHSRRVRRRDLSAKGRPPKSEKVAHLKVNGCPPNGSPAIFYSILRF